MIVKVKVGDKVTLSDGMYDDDRWGYARWVTEARGFVGVVLWVSDNAEAFQTKWVGLVDGAAPNAAVWVGDWVKVLGSTTE